MCILWLYGKDYNYVVLTSIDCSFLCERHHHCHEAQQNICGYDCNVCAIRMSVHHQRLVFLHFCMSDMYKHTNTCLYVKIQSHHTMITRKKAILMLWVISSVSSNS